MQRTTEHHSDDTTEHQEDEDGGGEVETATCPECDGEVVTDGSETVCGECGLVLGEDRIDHGPEWRGGTTNGERIRTGGVRTHQMHDKGLSTTFYEKFDANGNQLDGKKRRQLSRFKRESNRALRTAGHGRYHMRALAHMRKVAAAVEVNQDVREQAAKWIGECFEADIVRTRGYERVACACLYLACRVNGRAILPGDFTEHAYCDETAILRDIKTVARELDINTPPFRPQEHVGWIVSNLKDTEHGLVDDIHAHAARELLDAADDDGTLGSGASPSAQAAAAVWLSTPRNVTQESVGDAAECTEVTVRNRKMDLEPYQQAAADALLEGDDDLRIDAYDFESGGDE